jgi:predicted ATP-dependent serine protease
MKLSHVTNEVEETNVLDITIPEELKTRIKTKNSVIDVILGGGKGIVPSSVIYFTGVPGCGKSTILRQMGDSSFNECCTVYNSLEESKAQVALKAKDLELKKGFFICTHDDPDQLILNANKVVKNYPEKIPILIVDSLPGMQIGGKNDGVKVAERLVDWTKQMYGILFLIGHSIKSGKFAGKNEIQHLLDAHCHLYIDKRKRRWIDVIKDRFGVSKTYEMGIGNQGVYLIDDDVGVKEEEIKIFDLEETPSSEYETDAEILRHYDEEISKLFRC